MNRTESKTSDRLFESLIKLMGKNSTWQERITAHVHARTGHAHIGAFHHNGADETEKVALYKECLEAIVIMSKGGEPKLEACRPVVEVEAQVEVAPRVEPTPEVGRTEVASPSDDLADILARALESRIRPKVEPKINRADVVAIVQEEQESLLAKAQAMVDEAIKNLPPRATIEIREPGKEVREIKGQFHSQFPQVMTWLQSGVPLWLWGGAGGGKTTMAYQLAEALDVKPYVLSVDPTLTVGKLIGYRNLATGEFVEGLLYRPFKEGGLVCLDEIDTGDPSIIACLNSMIANTQYYFPSGEVISKHPQCYFLAGANTKGTGAVAGYTARNRLDAATLDRFAVVELTYDEGLEMALACGKLSQTPMWKPGTPASDECCSRFVAWVQACRKAAGNSILISPRASINGVKALKAGIPVDEVVEALVFKLTASDSKQRILNLAGTWPKE